MDGAVVIQPMIYDTLIERAKSRLLRLSDRVQKAPFLNRNELKEFTAQTQPSQPRQQPLFGETA